jgi:hypothetical protein
MWEDTGDSHKDDVFDEENATITVDPGRKYYADCSTAFEIYPEWYLTLVRCSGFSSFLKQYRTLH